MENIEWQNYRHPDFLQSLDLTQNDIRFLNLFLKSKFPTQEGLFSVPNNFLKEKVKT